MHSTGSNWGGIASYILFDTHCTFQGPRLAGPRSDTPCQPAVLQQQPMHTSLGVSPCLPSPIKYIYITYPMHMYTSGLSAEPTCSEMSLLEVHCVWTWRFHCTRLLNPLLLLVISILLPASSEAVFKGRPSLIPHLVPIFFLSTPSYSCVAQLPTRHKAASVLIDPASHSLWAEQAPVFLFSPF